MEYAIYKKPEKKEYRTKYDFFIPSLIAVNFTLLLVFNVLEPLRNLFLVRGPTDDSNTIINVFLVSLLIPLLIAMLMYSPVWYLLDSRLVYSNKRKVELLRDPIEIRSVGN
ncbi:MAG: hypothetical protein KGD63_04000 [Candidatus Lokiarchaeota archaeon]|nr:hypothetical protein [Candidatus Lokiarchaeota archaeon]